jgi:hypothetical protein
MSRGLLDAVVEALRNAGASDEAVAAAVGACAAQAVQDYTDVIQDLTDWRGAGERSRWPGRASVYRALAAD